MRAAAPILCMALASPVADAQAPQTMVGTTHSITFMMDFPQSDVAHYVLTVQQDGVGSYSATAGKNGGSADIHFRIAQPDAQKWFDLAKQTNYFAMPPAEIKRAAYQGTKTFTWDDGRPSSSTVRFSVTSLKPLQTLTFQAQALAMTLQAGQSLDEDLRFHPLQLDKELSSIDEGLKAGTATHPEVIAPQLRAVAADPNVLGKVRRQAAAILATLPAMD